MGGQSKQQLYATANFPSYQILKLTAALCYLVCKKADELRRETHDANNTWQCAFPVYPSIGQRSVYGVAEKQAKPAQPLAHSHSAVYLTYFKGSIWCQLSDGEKDWNSPSAAEAYAKSWTAVASSNFARQSCSTSASSRQHGHGALSSRSSLLSWNRAPPAVKSLRLFYNAIHPLVADPRPVCLHTNSGNLWPGPDGVSLF